MSVGVVVKGVVHGKTIELEREPGLPDGQVVTVTVESMDSSLANVPPGEGLRSSAGAWADDAEELDRYLEWSRQQRKHGRRDVDG
jgi:hypothetical protein